MHVYSVYEAKARLSEVLRTVKEHGEVVITQHGKRVARVVRIDSEDDETLDDRIDGFIARGTVRAARDAAKEMLAGPRTERAKGALRRFLEDR